MCYWVRMIVSRVYLKRLLTMERSGASRRFVFASTKRSYSMPCSVGTGGHKGLTSAYVEGSKDIPLLRKTIGSMLQEVAYKMPEQEGLVCFEERKRFTYRELDKRSDELAVGLLELGIEKGDRVAVWLPSCSQYTLLQYATAKIGAILVTMNPAYRNAEAMHAINLVGCKALVITPQVSKSDYLRMVQEMAPEICQQRGIVKLNLNSLPTLKHIINVSDINVNGMVKFKDLCRRGASVGRLGQRLEPDDIINIQFTSGTTGPPKAASLTHLNILNNGLFIAERLKYSPKDRVCVPVPLYHCFGLVIGNLAALTKGSTIVYPSGLFNPELTLKAVQREKCTSLYGVPSHFIAELSDKNFSKYDLSSLRTGVMAGSICPQQVMRQVMNQMHMKEVTICYGMTETSPVSFQSNTDDVFEKKISSVGKIHPHLEAKIVRDNGSICDIGEKGELWIRGYSVMKGYWNGRKDDNPITECGWMKTGDLCVLDKAGFCFVVGRKKDIIVRGGENIYPREIEEVIFKMEGVKQVSVIPVQSEKYGEEVCAVVSKTEFDGNTCTPSEFIDQIKFFAKDTLAHYKIPSKVVFMKMEDVPITVTGKIKKHELRHLVEREKL